MDRRQQKTRKAIMGAFTRLLSRKNYNKITIQEIIDEADVGRTTFYAHFETKDTLLQELCLELFDHIIESAVNGTHIHGLYSDGIAPQSVFCHLLQHLQENDSNILDLLSGENSELFLRYFKEGMSGLVQTQITARAGKGHLPEDFLVNHISSSFVSMVQWWIKGGMKETPEQLDEYFRKVIDPVFR